jgi:hypothetical protein
MLISYMLTGTDVSCLFFRHLYYWFYALIMVVCFRFRNVTMKEDNKQGTCSQRLLESGSRQEEELDSLGAVYDDTTRLLEKGGDSLKWGEVFQMFKR